MNWRQVTGDIRIKSRQKPSKQNGAQLSGAAKRKLRKDKEAMEANISQQVSSISSFFKNNKTIDVNYNIAEAHEEKPISSTDPILVLTLLLMEEEGQWQCMSPLAPASNSIMDDQLQPPEKAGRHLV